MPQRATLRNITQAAERLPVSVKAMQWAEDELLRSGLDPIDRLVLLCLAHRHNHKTDECFPSYETIATFAGCKRRRAIMAVNNLIEAGLIAKQKRRSGSQQASNGYLLFGRRPGPSRVHGDAPSNGASGCTTLHPENTPARVHSHAPDREERYIGQDAGHKFAEKAEHVDRPRLRLVEGAG